MRKRINVLVALALSVLATTAAFGQGGGGGGRQGGPPQPMSFFITSVGKGNGANYGGIAGADAYCQQMAMAAGRGGAMWHAYLSQPAANGMPAVNARDRIGSGPWYNQKGQMIARDLATLHGDTIDQARVGNALGKQISLTEKGTVVNGVGDMPNQHDILTGSRPDGTAFTDGMDHTCSNYTSNADTGSVQLGHADKQGGGNSSWNSAHPSAGCSQQKLVQTGGAGLLYCFAVN
jgi:hypothetical protein